MRLRVSLPAEADTLDLARALARALPPRFQLVALRGPLGAGKTSFVRGVVRAMGVTDAVRSPTYTLCETYEDCSPPVYHLDLYRLGDPEELEFLGLRDAIGATAWVFVEWFERGAGWLPEADLVVELSLAEPGREASLTGEADLITAVADRLRDLSALRPIVDNPDDKEPLGD